MADLYKSRLQNYAQKRNIAFPIYACEMQGPPHARLFKAKVTVDGNTFEGTEFCTTLKDAEHVAAKVAFTTLSPAETQEDDCLYKSLLQELAQKKGLLLPIYVTNKSGLPHMPTFASCVEIAGERFAGQEARTKKQAEMNAAKVAYTVLTKGGPRVDAAAVFPDNQMAGPLDFGSSSLQMVANDNKEPRLVVTTNKTQISVNEQAGYSLAKEAEKGKGEDIENLPVTLPPMVIHESQPKATMNVVDAKQLSNRRENLLTQVREGSGSNAKGNQRIPVTDLGAASPSSTKIVVRPHKPDMTYEGPIHFSDDEWVAMKVLNLKLEDEK